MTKRELITVLEALDVPDDTPVFIDSVVGCGQYSSPDPEITTIKEDMFFFMPWLGGKSPIIGKKVVIF